MVFLKLLVIKDLLFPLITFDLNVFWFWFVWFERVFSIPWQTDFPILCSFFFWVSLKHYLKTLLHSDSHWHLFLLLLYSENFFGLFVKIKSIHLPLGILKHILELIMLTKLFSVIKVVMIGLVGSMLKFPRITMFSKLLLHLSKIFVTSVLK